MKNTRLVFAGALLGLGALSPVFADPDLSVEFKVNEQKLRETLDFDRSTGIHGTGDVQLGSQNTTFAWLRNADANLVRENGELIGVENTFRISTRVSQRVAGADALTTDELRAAIDAGDVKLATEIAGGIHLTKNGTGFENEAGINIPLGQTEGTITQAVVPVVLNLKLVKIALVAGGAVTKGGVEAGGASLFDVEWEGNFKVKAGVSGGLQVLRGLKGAVAIQIEFDNAAIKTAMGRLVTETKELIRDTRELAKRGARRTKDVFTNYRGTTIPSSQATAEPAVGAPVDLSGATSAQVAARFAPVIAQQLEGDSNNTLLRVDFDGDWDTENNLNNSRKGAGDRTPTVYYDVKETATHYYVHYAFYFARQELNQAVGPLNFQKVLRQENDIEGCMVMARKGAKAGEEVELVLTTSNGGTSWTRYLSTQWEQRDLGNGKTAIRNGSVRFIDEVGHPQYDAEKTHAQLWVSKRAHNVWAYNGRDDVDPFAGNPGVVYHPSLSPQAPGSTGTVGYALRSMTELANATQKNGERLKGDEGLLNDQARLPQAWTTTLNGIDKGDLFRDPAGTIAKMYVVPGTPAPASGMTSVIPGGGK